MTAATIHARPESGGPTLDLLWRRMRERGSLPGLGSVLNSLKQTIQKPEDHQLSITRAVLADPALTQRVLRLANSAMYAVYGQGVSTVSRAVMVLGTESIGHLALGMKLIDDLLVLSNGSRTVQQEVEKAVLAGHIARQVTSACVSNDDEEAVVCAILQNLGKMLVSFYLPEKWAELQERIGAGSKDEKALAAEVLGLGLEQITHAVAEHWQLPKTITASLTPDFRIPERIENNRTAWLATVSRLSAECAGALSEGTDQEKRLADVAGCFASTLGLETAAICAAVKTAVALAENEAAMLRKRAMASPKEKLAAPPVERRRASGAELLYQSVAEMRSAGHAAGVGHLLGIALEGLHRGLAAKNTAVFLRNREQGRYSARMLLGDALGSDLSSLSFPDSYQPDVFHAAMASDKVVFVENAYDPIFRSKLPTWWFKSMRDMDSIVILPLSFHQKPIGMLVAAWSTMGSHQALSDMEISLLNEMRSIVVQSMTERI